MSRFTGNAAHTKHTGAKPFSVGLNASGTAPALTQSKVDTAMKKMLDELDLSAADHARMQKAQVVLNFDSNPPEFPRGTAGTDYQINHTHVSGSTETHFKGACRLMEIGKMIAFTDLEIETSVDGVVSSVATQPARQSRYKEVTQADIGSASTFSAYLDGLRTAESGSSPAYPSSSDIWASFPEIVDDFTSAPLTVLGQSYKAGLTLIFKPGDGTVQRGWLLLKDQTAAEWEIVPVGSSVASAAALGGDRFMVLTTDGAATPTSRFDDFGIAYAGDLEFASMAHVKKASSWLKHKELQTPEIVVSGGDNFINSGVAIAVDQSDYRTPARTAYKLFTGAEADFTQIRGTKFGFTKDAMSFMGFDASCVGNHEFDGGEDALARALYSWGSGYELDKDGVHELRNVGARFMHLSCNLDTSASTELAKITHAGTSTPSVEDARMALSTLDVLSKLNDTTATGLSAEVNFRNVQLAPFCLKKVSDDLTVGLVGVTCPNLGAISSASAAVIVPTAHSSIPASGAARTTYLTEMAGQINPACDKAIAAGADFVVLLSHNQQYTIDQELLPLVKARVIVSSGHNTFNPLARGTNSESKPSWIIVPNKNLSKYQQLNMRFDKLNGTLTVRSDYSVH